MTDEKFIKMYHKLFKHHTSFIDVMEGVILKVDKKDKTYIHNQKYTIRDYIIGIIEVLSNNVSWRKYNGKINGRTLNNKHNYYSKIGVYDELYKINGRTLNNKHNYYSKIGVYDELDKINIKKYINKNEESSKVLSIDSTFIVNKYGTEKVERNMFYKNKKGLKVTLIVEEKGVPLNVQISKGNRHDARIAPKILSKLKVNTNDKKYLLADKGYDSEKIREMIRKKGYKPIIAKRNTKHKKSSLKAKHIKIYKKRIIVENCFSWIKSYPKIDKLYEKTIHSYRGLLMLAISMLIYKRD